MSERASPLPTVSQCAKGFSPKNNLDALPSVPTWRADALCCSSRLDNVRWAAALNNKLTNAPEKVVVIGGSQGAVEALVCLIKQLPAEFPAPIFIVVHLPVEANSYLPRILQRAGALKVLPARDGGAIAAGRVYVAPPNFHLMLDRHTVRLQKGPRENRHRPAIDPLFRTAARAFGKRVIAVLLSGNLDDGSVGLLAVRARGGMSIVQDPCDAEAGEMPRRALTYAGADYVLPVAEIGAKLVELLQSRNGNMRKSAKNRPSQSEVRRNEKVAYIDEGNGEPSVFACPECHGVLWEVKEGRLARYRCRVGHSYTAASLKTELDESAERALWAAMRALEEKAAMSRRLAGVSKGLPLHASRLQEQAAADTENAEIVRQIVLGSDADELAQGTSSRRTPAVLKRN